MDVVELGLEILGLDRANSWESGQADGHCEVKLREDERNLESILPNSAFRHGSCSL